MTEPELSPRLRLIASLPVFSALFVYALAHHRWIVAPLFAVALAGALFARAMIDRRPWHILAVGGLGAGLGFLTLLQGGPPASALPSAVLSPLCGALACLACFLIVAQRYMYAWTYAWLLAAFCLHVAPFGAIWIAFLALVLSTLACSFVLDGAVRLGGTGAIGFVIYLALLVPIAFGLTRLALRSEQAMLSAVIRWTENVRPPSGISLGSDVAIEGLSDIQLSTRPLLELDGPPPAYLRTMVLDKFDGILWTTAAGKRGVRRTHHTPLARMPTVALPPPALRRKQTMLFLESLDDVIPAPAGTFQIDGTPSRPEPGWVWRTMSPIRGEIQLERNAYERLPPEAPTPIDTELPKNALGDLRALLLPYARKIVAGTRTPREKAERIAHFFQAHFKYSLRTDLRGREPPLVVLIRDRRPAYCIYFASAMAALLRSLDIPARLVTGFVPSETNPIDGRTIVRLRDAHAWVEVYLPSEGRYVSFDPTPPESREALLGLGRMGWVKGIVLAARSALRRAWLALKQNPVGTVAAALRSPFVAVPVCGLALWIVWRRRRLGPRKKHQGALRSGDKALRTAYRKYLKQLARAGLTPSRAETDDELLDRLTATRGMQVRQAAEAFVWAYRRARYADVDTREELQGLLKRLEVELKAA